MIDPNLPIMQGEEIDQLHADKAALREMLQNLWPPMRALSDIIQEPNIALGVTTEGRDMVKRLISNMEEVLRNTK